MQALVRWYNWFSNLGNDGTIPRFETLKLIIVNRVTLFIMIGTLFLVLESFFDAHKIEFIEIIAVFVPMGAFFLNHKKKYFQARIYLGIFYPLVLSYFFFLWGEGLKLDIAFLGFIIAALAAFENNYIKGFIALYISGLYAVCLLYSRTEGNPLAFEVSIIDSFLVVLITMSSIGVALILFKDEIQRQIKSQTQLLHQLKEKNEELTDMVKQNNTKNELIGIIAHDLKGPASAFKNLTEKFSYLIRKDKPERIIEMADHFENAGTNLQYTLDNLLNWVIAQKKGIDSIPKPIPLKAFVEDIILELKVYSLKRKIDIKNNITPELTIQTDPNIMRIIIMNFLHNALKFSAPMNSIILGAVNSDKKTGIYIRDFGIGIDSPQLESIIKNTKVPDSTNFSNTGHGLGIKSCFSLIKHLKGNIDIQSVLGSGTTITIWVPAIHANVNEK